MTMHFLRVIFFGTPEFSEVVLAAIHKAGFHIELVFTQLDRRSERGMRLQKSAVKQYAINHGIPVAQPHLLGNSKRFSTETSDTINLLKATPHDVIVVAAYGLLLPREFLSIPHYGCINVHASLLPRWRGAAPIHRAIEAGDKETGITLIQMDTGLDTGSILRNIRVQIELDDTTSTLCKKLSSAASIVIVDTLTELEKSGRLVATPQSIHGVTYAEKIRKHEAILNWRKPADTLSRQILAFDPFPGCIGTLKDGMTIKIWKAQPILTNSRELIGTIIESGPEGITVMCGTGALRITQLQKPGGKRLSARHFLLGTPIISGNRFSIIG